MTDRRIYRDKGREEALDDTDAIAAAREAGRREMRDECAAVCKKYAEDAFDMDRQLTASALEDAIRSIPVRKASDHA